MDIVGATALHKAAAHNKLDCLLALLEKGADVNKADIFFERLLLRITLILPKP